MTKRMTSILTNKTTKHNDHHFYQEHKAFFWMIAYGIFYLAAFYLLEQRQVRIHLIHCKLDDLIPFCQYFIIPYVLWFPFMGLTLLYFGLIQKDKKQFTQLAWNLCIGTTIFLFVSWIYPNGHGLRPALHGDDIFTEAVRILYQVDTSTNILPSLHVYGTVVSCIAILESPQLRNKKVLRASTVILSLSIIASTVFLKQHSAIDGVTAIMLNIVCFVLCYRTEKLKQIGQQISAVLPKINRQLRYRTMK